MRVRGRENYENKGNKVGRKYTRQGEPNYRVKEFLLTQFAYIRTFEWTN